MASPGLSAGRSAGFPEGSAVASEGEDELMLVEDAPLAGPQRADGGTALDLGVQASLDLGRQGRPLGLEASAERDPARALGGRFGVLVELLALDEAVGPAEPDDLQRLAEVRPMGHDLRAPARFAGRALDGGVAAAEVGEEDGAGAASSLLLGGGGGEVAGFLACGDGLGVTGAPAAGGAASAGAPALAGVAAAAWRRAEADGSLEGEKGALVVGVCHGLTENRAKFSGVQGPKIIGLR